MTVRDAMITELVTLGENDSVLTGLKLLVKEKWTPLVGQRGSHFKVKSARFIMLPKAPA